MLDETDAIALRRLLAPRRHTDDRLLLHVADEILGCERCLCSAQ
jgi:hypothetical protein